jgi:ketosteroid isomerase-like protein
MSETKQPITADQIVALENAALDRWGKGDPGGYLELMAPGITYFDPFTAVRLDGYDAIEEYLRPVAGKIWIDRHEMLNPQVTIEGGLAVLTFNLVDYLRGSDKPSCWNSTEVYQRFGDDWKIVHSHWSFTKPALQQD